MKKCDFLKTLQWPDFETLWGNQGHNNVKHGINGSSRTFFFSGGLLRPVVINDERMAVHCLESGCIRLYIPPLGSVHIQYSDFWEIVIKDLCRQLAHKMI